MCCNDYRYNTSNPIAVDKNRRNRKGQKSMSTSTALRVPSTTTWSIDPVHSIAEFKVKHMMISSVKGHFSKIADSLTIDESGHANSHVKATIDAASIETRDGQRDTHLKSEDFLHVEKFLALTFQSTSINQVGA